MEPDRQASGSGLSCVDVSGDQALGERRRLAHEEPVPPGGGETGVAAGECLADGHVSKDDNPVDATWAVECQALHDVAPAIVADCVESLPLSREVARILFEVSPCSPLQEMTIE